MAVEVKYVVIREGEEKMSFQKKRKPGVLKKSLWQVNYCCIDDGILLHTQ
ncbi:YebG family protein [Escherichia coli]|nr:YebG family protein [Escherichia coli]